MDSPTSYTPLSKRPLAPANTHFLGDSTSAHTRIFRATNTSGYQFKPLTTVPTLPELPLRTSDSFEPQSSPRYYNRQPINLNHRRGVPLKIMTSFKTPSVLDRCMLEHMAWARESRILAQLPARRREDPTQFGSFDARSPSYERPRTPITLAQEKSWFDHLCEDMSSAVQGFAIVATLYLTMICGLRAFGAFLEYGITV